MKLKNLAVLLCGVAMCLVANTAKADGTINFFTFNANTAFGQVYLPGTSTSVGTTFLGQLYVSSSANGTYVAVGTPVAFQGGGVGNPSAINSSTPVTVTGAFGGDVYFYKLAAWNSSAGSTFEAAKASQSGIAGLSSSVQITLGGTPNGGGASFPSPQSNGFTSFQLAAVPEPTTIALGVAGGLALLARRRRNA